MTDYQALTPETLPRRLAAVDAIATRLGGESEAWRCREVGDGNLNLVFVVEGETGTLVVKQALPYVRLVGESWPLPLERSFFEYHALTRQAARDPGRVPEIHHFDEAQALIAMEYLAPHVILRRSLVDGTEHPRLAEHIGLFMARTLFRGSDLAMETADRKADVALFAANVALCDITENLVFTDPYFDAEQNRHTSPQLDVLVAELRGDIALKVEAQRLKAAFCSRAETLLHGDLHSGSIMVHGDDARVIDPEFALYGPMGFDVGMYLANLWMAACAQPGHASRPGERDDFRDAVLAVVHETWRVFADEFARLWHTERRGILYPDTVLASPGEAAGVELALAATLADIWRDALGFAGVEMHRRILGLAHNLDFEAIESADRRARCEAQALRLGRDLVLGRHVIADTRAVERRLRQLAAPTKEDRS